MRIIGGTAKGRRLETFSGRGIRPTPDRVREAIFSALLSRLGNFADLAVLDLFAGSGAMGLEALSRGARRAVFIDSGAQSLRLVRTNLDRCGLARQAEVLRGEAVRLLPQLGRRGPFDLVFLDPPYGRELVPAILTGLAQPGLLRENALICAETGAADPVAADYGPLHRTLRRTYGSTAVHLFRPASDEDEAP